MPLFYKRQFAPIGFSEFLIILALKRYMDLLCVLLIYKGSVNEQQQQKKNPTTKCGACFIKSIYKLIQYNEPLEKN